MNHTAETEDLKARVREYWQAQACGTRFTERPKLTREYFDEIEAHRYAAEPEIFSFAQFTRHHGQAVLEIGVGAATDFIQWLRAGARAHGIDLTDEAIDHARERAAVYGLTPADLRVGDCEALPYEDGSFDLVYSWGVLHHTPDTPRAVGEAVRVTRPGGSLKIMLYNRRSLTALWVWVRGALLKGRPWKSVKWALHHHLESVGTQAFTPAEMRRMVSAMPVTDVRIRTAITYYDKVEMSRSGAVRFIARSLAWILGGDRVGWFMLIEMKKAER
jgi:SAM-dependent methyltransferase